MTLLLAAAVGFAGAFLLSAVSVAGMLWGAYKRGHTPRPRPLMPTPSGSDPGCARYGHAWPLEPAAGHCTSSPAEKTGVIIYHCQRTGCPEVWIDGWICGPGELVEIRRPGETSLPRDDREGR